MPMNIIVHLIIKNTAKTKYEKICLLYKLTVFKEFREKKDILYHYNLLLKAVFLFFSFVHINYAFFFVFCVLVNCRVGLTDLNHTRTRTVLFFFVCTKSELSVCKRSSFSSFIENKMQDENRKKILQLVKFFFFFCCF